MHLASIGSPLADAPVPPAVAISGPPPGLRLAAGARPGRPVAVARAAAGRTRLAARRTRWAAGDAKIKAIEARVNPSLLSIMQ